MTGLTLNSELDLAEKQRATLTIHSALLQFLKSLNQHVFLDDTADGVRPTSRHYVLQLSLHFSPVNMFSVCIGHWMFLFISKRVLGIAPTQPRNVHRVLKKRGARTKKTWDLR